MPFAIILRPGMFRSGPVDSNSKPPVVIPRSARSVAITLLADAELGDHRYRVALTHSDRVIWEDRVAARPGRRNREELKVTVPASILEDGEYSITLFPADRDEPTTGLYDYVLDVKRK